MLYFYFVKTAFSSRITWPVQVNALSLLKASIAAEGGGWLDLSESNPTRVGLPSLFSSCGEKAAETGPDAWPRLYEPDPRGSPAAREAISRFYGRGGGGRRAFAPDPDRLFLCASTSEAYGWLFKLLCDPGDAVLVPRPGYPLFDYLASLEAVEARAYRLEHVHPQGWLIDLDSLETGLAAGGVRAVVLINPNNPTGSYLCEEERRAIIDLCARCGAAIIADEVFFGFPVEPGPRRSFLGEEEVLCFVLDGLSKLLGLPQAKLGWIACSGPAEAVAEASARLEIVADAYLSAGAPIMRALPGLLEREGDFGGPARERVAANMAAARGLLEGPQSPHRLYRCSGGWTAIVESPRFAPEEDLAAGLLRRAGIWSQPGFLFDMEKEACFTLSLILPPELLRRGLEGYRRYFDELAEDARP